MTSAKNLLIRGVVLTNVFVATLTAQSSNAAQDLAATQQIETEAARAVKIRLPSGSVAFDARIDTRGKLQKARAPIHSQSLSSLLGTRLTTGEVTRDCPDGKPTSCRIVGAQALVSMNSPRFRGDTASVIVGIVEMTTFVRQPVAERDIEVLLVKRAGRWTFVGFGKMRAS